MKKLAIRFSDNDFVNTIRPWLTLLTDGHLDEVEKMTKQEIVDLFNRSAAGVYWVSQNKMRYQSSEADVASIAKYLTTDDNHVFFDEEVDQYIAANKGWDNDQVSQNRGAEGGASE